MKVVQNPYEVFEALTQPMEVRPTKHWLSESMSCEDVVLTFRHLRRIRSERFTLSERSAKEAAPPHLVSAGAALWKESRLAVARALDAELTHPVAKGVGMDIQDFRRALRPINHSICLLKGGQDMASLHFFQRGQS